MDHPTSNLNEAGIVRPPWGPCEVFFGESMGRIVVRSIRLWPIPQSMSPRSPGTRDHRGDLLGNALEADNLTRGSGPQVFEEHDVWVSGAPSEGTPRLASCFLAYPFSLG